MINVIVVKERNAKTGRMEEIVSHGVDSETLKNIILPQVSPKELGAVYDKEHGYILRDQK